MGLVQFLNRYPGLGFCTIALLALGLLGAWLTLHFAGQQQAEHTQQYGQALADQGAEQALEPTLAQDMISLQVIVQSLAEQPTVLRANIRDVENRLLVESGTSSAPPGFRTPYFNAPITLDSHIAGRLTVTLQEPPLAQSYNLFLSLWGALVLLCSGGLWLALYGLQRRREQQQLTASEREANSPQPAEPATQHTVAIELVFLNLPQLQQQLSRTGFYQRLQHFDQSLNGILALYAGRKQPLRGQRILLQVTGDTLADASFYALCICQLALRLSLSGDSPTLKLAANVLPELDDAPSSLLQSYQQLQHIPPEHQTPAVWVAPALQSEQLEKHVHINAEHQLEQIKPPYFALLQRQEQQLASIVNVAIAAP